MVKTAPKGALIWIHKMILEPSKKLSRMIAWQEKLSAAYCGTWRELFKTNGYKKSQIAMHRLRVRISKQISLELGDKSWKTYSIISLHRHSWYFVKIRMYY